MEITVKKPTPQELETLGVKSWGIWTCEAKTFDWQYDDREICFFLAGKVTVKAGKQEVHFGTGDLVTFPKGLSCTWIVHEPVRKHYRFG